MDGVLISDPHTPPAAAGTWSSGADLAQRLARLEQTASELRDEVDRLRQENAELRRENAELKQQVQYWKAMHARAVEREAKLAEELKTARGEIRQLRDKLYGRKSEQEGRRDRSNQLDDPREQDAVKPPRPPPAVAALHSEMVISRWGARPAATETRTGCSFVGLRPPLGGCPFQTTTDNCHTFYGKPQ